MEALAAPDWGVGQTITMPVLYKEGGVFKMVNRRMFIYISGPYSPRDNITDIDLKEQAIKENIKRANDVALKITNKGHIPFVPHTMMQGWEDIHRVPRDQALNICHKWVEKCDALFFMAPSKGADSERQLATKLGLPIYRSLDDIPDTKTNSSLQISPEAFQAYLVEYQECIESYRHTYGTIWQAGAFSAAIAAAIISFTGNGDLFQFFTPLPLIFWYLGIFIPMNRYGELRNDRLMEIEELLNDNIPSLKMRHFSKYGHYRKNKIGFFKRIYKGKWRVNQVVTVFIILIIIMQFFLIWKMLSLP